MHATKKPKMILIDGENVPDQLELLSQISDSDVRIYLFLGPTQAKVPTDLWERFQPLGERVKIVRMKGTGKNSLDFLMAFHFGSLSKETRNADYYILSKDKGFDPLVLHVRENEHISCERKEKAQDIFSQKRDSRDPGTAEKRAEMFLQKIKTRTRPRKLAKLRNDLASHFPGITERGKDAVVSALENKGVKVVSGRIVYPDEK